MNDLKKNMLARLNRLFWVCLVFCLPNAVAGEERLPIDYSDWYQVEVIVFSPLKGADFGETSKPLEKNYPADLITISAASPDDIKPQNLSQLTQLQALTFLNQSLESESDEATTSQRQEEFIFGNRSLHNQPEVVAKADIEQLQIISATDLEDLDPAGSDSDLSQLSNLDHIEDLLYPADPAAFQQLAQNELFLGGLSRSLRRSSQYRFLKHMAWRQPIRSSEAPTPILIQTGDHFDDHFMIDGTLSISRSRYLHVSTDLWFTEFTPKYGAGPLNNTPVTMDKETRDSYPEVAKWEQLRDQQLPLQSYPLQQARRMRSATLHYIDHPLFGILIQIDRYRGEQGST